MAEVENELPEVEVARTVAPARPDPAEEQQVTEIKTTRYKELRGRGEGRRQGRMSSSRLQKRVEVLDMMAEDPDHSDCNIKWKRIHPRVDPQSGIALIPYNGDMSMPISKWSDVCTSIRDLCGGGRYRVEVYNSGGQTEHVLECTIDMHEYPPKNPPNSAAYPNSYNGNGMMNGPGRPQSDVVRNQIESKVKRDEQTADLEHEMRIEDLEEKREERSYKKDQREKDRQEDKRGKTDSKDPLLLMLVEHIKSSNQNVVALLEKMSQPKEGDSTMVMMMKLMQDQSNTQMENMRLQMQTQLDFQKSQMAADATRAANIPKPDNSHMEMMFKLHQETTNLMMNMNSNKGDDGGLVKQLMGVLIGNLKDAKSGNANSMTEAMNVIGQVKNILIDGVAPVAMEEGEGASPWAALLNQIGTGVGQGIASRFAGGGGGQQPQQPNPQQPVANPAHMLPATNPDGSSDVNFDESPQRQQGIAPPSQAAPPAPDPDTPAGRMHLLMTELMQIAIIDMNSESRQHNWVTPAVENLPQKYLDAICKIPPDVEGEAVILNRIKPYCDAETYTELMAILGDQAKFTQCYVQFFSAWNQVKEQHSERKSQEQQGQPAEPVES